MQFHICVYLNFPSLLHEAATLTAPASAPLVGLVMLAMGTALGHVSPPILVLMPALGPQSPAGHAGPEKQSPSAPCEMSVVAVRTRSHWQLRLFSTINVLAWTWVGGRCIR